MNKKCDALEADTLGWMRPCLRPAEWQWRNLEYCGNHKYRARLDGAEPGELKEVSRGNPAIY